MIRPKQGLAASGVALAAIALLVAACSGSPNGDEASPVLAFDHPPLLTPDTEVVATAMVLQEGDGPIQFCLAGHLSTAAPVCEGAELLGFGWSDARGAADIEEYFGVRFAELTLVGHYDVESHRFRVTREVEESMRLELSAAPDVGVATVAAGCDDPYEGHRDQHRAPAGEDQRTDLERWMQAETELSLVLEAHDPLVDWWVTGEDRVLTLAVNAVREQQAGSGPTVDLVAGVWPGPICTVPSQAPTRSDRQAAAQAVAAVPGVANTAAGSGLEPRLEVQVFIAEETVIAAVVDAAAPWLGTDDLLITTLLRPVAEFEAD